MSPEEYKELERLLAKLQRELGGIYFIMPESEMDGVRIITYVYEQPSAHENREGRWRMEFENGTIHATIESTVKVIMSKRADAAKESLKDEYGVKA